ncbi:hypothetical protein G3N18_00175 [Microbacterium sp. 2C]|uniref:hypothetical protein n=1 Tax=Microbacteriaceae TaxID=85023 RepID=UPI00117CAF74|nr:MULTISPECIES: hypothetical protein [Microbacteriaceae]MBG0716515.1 hypothetical protein [Microbacterium paulum]
MTDPTTPDHQHVDHQRLADHDQRTGASKHTDAPPTSTPTGAAEDARASEFATHGDPTLVRGGGASPVSPRPGVQWVRPTDVAARAGAVVLDRGAELNMRLRDAVLDGVREGRAQLQERLARREEALDPDSSSPTNARERVVGRTGVSR